jgi:hypothetical protein
MDTGQKTESVLRLVEDIQSGAVTLPEFQRDFVWDIEKTYDLFDSFVKDIFTGSLIYGVPSFEITVRELDVRPRTGGGSRKRLALTNFTKAEIDRMVKTKGFRLLLDGQQRATSIYRSLTGIDAIYFVVKPDSSLSAEVLEVAPSKRTLEQVLEEFTGSAPSDRVAISLHHVFRITLGEYSRESEKAQLAAQYPFANGLSADELQLTKEFEVFLSQAKNLENLFRQEKLVSYYLLDTDAEKFALFFERSNSKGLQLNFIDILAAKLYAGFNLRQSIERFEDENPNLMLFREGVVRVISYIVSGGKETGRAYILGSLGHAHFVEHWPSVISLYKKCYEFLFINRWVIHQDWMPYDNMIIPMILFLRNIPKQDFANATPSQLRVLQAWWWASIFSRRYSSAAQTFVSEDSRMLEAVSSGDFSTVPDYFRKISLVIRDRDDLVSVHKKYDALYKGVFNLIHFSSKGLVGMFNGMQLTESSELEDHHIFPRDFLKGLDDGSDVDWKQKTDCVLNRTLVPKAHNLKFAAKRPSEYLAATPGSDDEKSLWLEKHLVPKELLSGLYDDFYDDFLVERGNRVLVALDEHARALIKALIAADEAAIV